MGLTKEAAARRNALTRGFFQLSFTGAVRAGSWTDSSWEGRLEASGERTMLLLLFPAPEPPFMWLVFPSVESAGDLGVAAASSKEDNDCL